MESNKKQLKEFVSKTRDSSGKYIPQSTTTTGPVIIEDGAFVSPSKKIVTEKGQRDRTVRGYVPKSSNVIVTSDVPKYQHVFESQQDIKSLDVLDAFVPFTNTLWDYPSDPQDDVSTGDFVFREPLIIDQSNSYVRSLQISLPFTFTPISSSAFSGLNSDKTKAKNIVLQTDQEHNLSVGSIVKLLDDTGSVSTLYDYTISSVPDAKSLILFVNLKTMRGNVKKDQVPYIDTGFLPSYIFVEPPLTRQDIAKRVQVACGKNVIWNDIKQCYQVHTGLEIGNYTSLVDGEVVMFRNPFRARLPPGNYAARGNDLAATMQRLINIPYVSPNSIFKCGESLETAIDVTITEGEHDPEDLAQEIANAANLALSWTEDNSKLHGEYDAILGKFSFYRNYSALYMQFPLDIGTMFGFGSAALSGSFSYQSSPIHYAHYIDSKPVYPITRYCVFYDSYNDTLRVGSVSDGNVDKLGKVPQSIASSVILPFLILPCPIQSVLGFAPHSQSNRLWLGSKKVANLLPPLHLFVSVKDFESNSLWISRPYGTSKPEKRKCLAMLSLDATKGCYNLQRTFMYDKLTKTTTDTLEISIYTPSGILYNTGGMEHNLVFQIST